MSDLIIIGGFYLLLLGGLALVLFWPVNPPPKERTLP